MQIFKSLKAKPVKVLCRMCREFSIYNARGRVIFLSVIRHWGLMIETIICPFVFISASMILFLRARMYYAQYAHPAQSAVVIGFQGFENLHKTAIFLHNMHRGNLLVGLKC